MTDIYALVSPAPPAVVGTGPAFSRKQMVLGGIAILVVLINLVALMLYFCVKRGFCSLFEKLHWRRKGKIGTNRFLFLFSMLCLSSLLVNWVLAVGATKTR